MSEKHPTPWKFDIDDADEPIKDANGERVFATDDGFLGPDDDTIREIVDAVNERDRLRDQLAAALRLADECSRDAAAVHAGRARAVEEAQSEANRRADRLADIVRRLSRHLANYITSESENDLLREARAAIGEDAP